MIDQPTNALWVYIAKESMCIINGVTKKCTYLLATLYCSFPRPFASGQKIKTPMRIEDDEEELYFIYVYTSERKRKKIVPKE